MTKKYISSRRWKRERVYTKPLSLPTESGWGPGLLPPVHGRYNLTPPVKRLRGQGSTGWPDTHTWHTYSGLSRTTLSFPSPIGSRDHDRYYPSLPEQGPSVRLESPSPFVLWIRYLHFLFWYSRTSDPKVFQRPGVDFRSLVPFHPRDLGLPLFGVNGKKKENDYQENQRSDFWETN